MTSVIFYRVAFYPNYLIETFVISFTFVYVSRRNISLIYIVNLNYPNSFTGKLYYFKFCKQFSKWAIHMNLKTC